MPLSTSALKRRRYSQADGSAAHGSGNSSSHANEARKDLLKRIGDFTIKHDLQVTGPNLSAICGAMSGSNAEIAEAFAAREISGEPIDQRWLDKIVRLDPESNARMAELEKLSDQLEYSLMRFAQMAKTAHDETSDHRGALDAQIEAIENVDASDEPGDGVKRIIDLSRAMLERIEQAEKAMERSNAETEKLRESLAKARMEADVDFLTRLPNRRAFERRFVTASTEARAKNKPLCVAFCDVDHFKAVNDKHGHEAGDRVLVSIAATLSENASDECFVGRHGGEEFVVLLYGHDKDAAWRKLDGIRRAQAAKQLMNRETGKPFGKITFSGGIAEVTENSDTRSALVRADEALYQAKEEGRNRIVAV